jgi:triphosphatase
VKPQTEVELKFLVPAAARAAVAAEVARGTATLQRMTLAAHYLDTEDRRLARQGIAWRLRREGRRWIQTLKAPGSNALERFEHEVVRPDASHDASEHAGTPVGDQLIALLRRARADGVEPGVRFQTEVRRTTRKIRTQGALVEVAFDEGRLLSAGAAQRVREIEFELVSGAAGPMLALAERWRKRFGLIHDPRSKAERGDQLAQGSPFPTLRKASHPSYARRALAAEAFAAVVDECLEQITRNAIGLIEGDPALRAEHVHQLRVGIRRIRSAVRSFRGWAPSPPAELVDGLRDLFATLGLARDRDVLDDGVVAELAKFGAPPLAVPAAAAGPDPAALVAGSEAQRLFLAWITWRANLEGALLEESSAVADKPDAAVAVAGSLMPGVGGVEEAVASRSAPDDAPSFRRNVERRLRRWHRRLVADWQSFDELDETSLHALRKRSKRQRYAVEFFAPMLKRGKAERYLNVLTAFQDRMGELNDLFVARARYQSLVASDPAAWFALGWLAARIADVRALAKPELGRLAKIDPPTA